MSERIIIEGIVGYNCLGYPSRRENSKFNSSDYEFTLVLNKPTVIDCQSDNPTEWQNWFQKKLYVSKKSEDGSPSISLTSKVYKLDTNNLTSPESQSAIRAASPKIVERKANSDKTSMWQSVDIYANGYIKAGVTVRASVEKRDSSYANPIYILKGILLEDVQESFASLGSGFSEIENFGIEVDPANVNTEVPTFIKDMNNAQQVASQPQQPAMPTQQVQQQVQPAAPQAPVQPVQQANPFAQNQAQAAPQNNPFATQQSQANAAPQPANPFADNENPWQPSGVDPFV